MNVADTRLDVFSQLINIKRNLIRMKAAMLQLRYIQLLEGDEWSSNARPGHLIPAK